MTNVITNLNHNFTSLRSFASESITSFGSTISSHFSRFVEWASKSTSPAQSEAIAQKQAATWECLDRISDGPGYIYKFRLKSEYDPTANSRELFESAYGKVFFEIFPAVEPGINAVVLLDPEMTIEKWFQKQNSKTPGYEGIKDKDDLAKEIALMKRIQELGYRYEADATGHYLYLPDKEALQARFELLRKSHPHLKPLNIIHSSGIATDMEFVEAYLAGYDCLLSLGTEFVHDHIAHVIPTILLMLTDMDYVTNKSIVVEMVRAAYNRIITTKKALEQGMPGVDPAQMKKIQQQLPKIETSLGTAVDNFWAISKAEDLDSNGSRKVHFDTERCAFVDVWDLLAYERYATRRFGESIDATILKDVWAEMELVEKKYTPVL